MDPPYPAEEYIERTNEGRTYLHAERFRVMRKEVEYKSVTDAQGFLRVTYIGGWTKSWNSWGCRGVLDTETLGQLEMTFVRCFDARTYVDELVGLFRDRRYD